MTTSLKLHFLLKQNQKKKQRQGILRFFLKKVSVKMSSPKLDGGFNPFEKHYIVKFDFPKESG